MAKDKEPKSTTEVIKDIMDSSRFGVIAHAFVFQALDQFATLVLHASPDELQKMDYGFISSESWQGVAKEIRDKVRPVMGKSLDDEPAIDGSSNGGKKIKTPGAGMVTIHDSERCQVDYSSTGPCLELTNSDGRSAFLQGEEVGFVMNNNSKGQSWESICDEYDHVMH